MLCADIIMGQVFVSIAYGILEEELVVQRNE
jgi:hypothetical protein